MSFQFFHTQIQVYSNYLATVDLTLAHTTESESNTVGGMTIPVTIKC